MDLDRKFQDATSYHSVKISSLEVDRKYPITPAERIVTKVFMPKRYGSTFSDVDIEDINTEKVLLHLIYKGICDNTKSHILAFEKKNRLLCTSCIFMIKL
jgi:hypothetical protein